MNRNLCTIIALCVAIACSGCKPKHLEPDQTLQESAIVVAVAYSPAEKEVRVEVQNLSETNTMGILSVKLGLKHKNSETAYKSVRSIGSEAPTLLIDRPDSIQSVYLPANNNIFHSVYVGPRATARFVIVLDPAQAFVGQEEFTLDASITGYPAGIGFCRDRDLKTIDAKSINIQSRTR